MRILLVEDNMLIGNAVRDHMVAHDWTVDWATDLKSATAAVDQTRYGLVLLDLRLPDGNGLDLLRHIKDGSPLPPVIIMSAYDQISDQIEGLRIGAVDYLIKPFNLDELVLRIGRIANRLEKAADTNRRLFATPLAPLAAGSHRE